MLIATYFQAGRTASSLLDLQLLLYYISSGEVAENRKIGLYSKNSNVFEKCLLEQRLCDEIIMLLESGKGFLLDQVLDPDYKREEYKEFYGEEDNSNFPEYTSSLLLLNEDHIQHDLKIMQNDYEKALPLLQAKLVVIPDKMSAECLRMVRAIDYDDYGKFKVNPFVVPGVQLRVMDFSELQKDLTALQEFKPDRVIMFDHNNFFIRHFQVSTLLDNPIHVSVLVGECYLEGWLYKHRERREEETFSRLIKSVARLHGVKNRAEDRVRLDSGLKCIKPTCDEQIKTGKPGNTINKEGPPVLIDKREFMSDAPGLLYFNGYQTVPMFLKTGDYILYDHVAIERKVGLS